MHQKGMFDTVKPINFNTIATPHIGLLRYPTLFSRFANAVGPKLLSRTGEQFFGVDKWSQRGRPLIEVMADPGACLIPATIASEDKTERIMQNACFIRVWRFSSTSEYTQIRSSSLRPSLQIQDLTS
jgi:hypothetical protein